MPCAFFLHPVPPIDIGFDHLAEGVVHTAVEIEFGSDGSGMTALRHGGIEGTKVDAGTETTTAIGTRSDTSLYLQTAHAACHISQVDPEDRLTLGIIERHLVHGHVDTRLVGTAHMEIGVADSQTVI